MRIRILAALVIMLGVFISAKGQKTTVKAGLLSDGAMWNNHATPSTYDSVTLLHDLTVDLPAQCRFLNTNGHLVHVNSGVQFNVGNAAQTRDTATLLTTFGYKYDDDGTLYDSTRTVIKNAYVNGHKKIISTLTDLTTGMDMSATHFEYDSLNRLYLVTLYNADTVIDGVYRERMTWANNQVVKIETGWNSQIEDREILTYTSNGTNTDITSVYDLRSEPDTFYLPDGSISSYHSYKYTGTVDSKYNPLAEASYYQMHYVDIGNGSSASQYDTSKYVYVYSNMENLTQYIQYRSAVDSNLYNNSTIRYRDTTIEDYVRDTFHNATLYELRKEIFGKEPLLLSAFTSETIAGTDDLDNLKQCINNMHYKRMSYENGIPQPANLYDDYLFPIANIFDSRKRLIKQSYTDVYGPSVHYVIRYVYP